jgi:hypothetical protein
MIKASKQPQVNTGALECSRPLSSPAKLDSEPLCEDSTPSTLCVDHKGCIQVTPLAPDSSSQGTPIPVEHGHDIDSSCHLDEDAREAGAALDTANPCNSPHSQYEATSLQQEEEACPCSTYETAGQQRSSKSMDSEAASLQGLPVTNGQILQAGPCSNAYSIRAMGPATFQAVREIGQGAFGKVRAVLKANDARTQNTA